MHLHYISQYLVGGGGGSVVSCSDLENKVKVIKTIQSFCHVWLIFLYNLKLFTCIHREEMCIYVILSINLTVFIVF